MAGIGLFKRSAEGGNVASAYELGMCFLSGVGNRPKPLEGAQVKQNDDLLDVLSARCDFECVGLDNYVVKTMT